MDAWYLLVVIAWHMALALLRRQLGKKKIEQAEKTKGLAGDGHSQTRINYARRSRRLQ
jgi:hypothetical protein